MDKFEYGLICLVFKDEGESTKGFVRISTFEVKGGKPIKNTVSFELEGSFSQVEHTERVDQDNGYYIVRSKMVVASGNPNYSISVLLPYLAIYGSRGWEAVGYKTDDDPVFGQVLIKRKVD